MTNYYTTPPAHCWDKIEQILDEQDIRRKNTNKLITYTYKKTENVRRTNYAVAAFAGISLAALVMMKFGMALKTR